ncbi:MAG: UbiA prenyltransferase family protein [Promethearchaeota archaeon]
MMKTDSWWKIAAYFLAGMGVLLFGMTCEFLLGLLLPSEAMQALYFHSGFLILIILGFLSGMLLIRRGLLGGWRYRYDSLIYVIAAVICLASAGQTLAGFQMGHPWLELQDTNPLLMNVLWVFVLPPLNPWIMIVLGGCFLALAWVNMKNQIPSAIITSESEVTPDPKKPLQWWQTLAGLTRISVWLGSLFLLIISFLILGGPPLSPPPNILVYYPIMWIRLGLAVGSVIIFNSATFIVNQIGDVDTDQLNSKKARLPVAAGRISRNQAALLSVGLLVLGMILGFGVGTFFVGIMAITFLFAILYSFPPIRLKSRPFFDLLIIGLAFGSWAVITAWAIFAFYSLGGFVGVVPELPFVLVLGAGVFYAGTHCIHTASDYQADAAAGITTTAVYIGPQRSSRLGIALIAVGMLLLYIAVGFFTHLFWYGLLKYKTIFLLIFLGLPFFTLFEQFRGRRRKQKPNEPSLERLQKQGRRISYLLFFVLLIYLLFYLFLFYPIYYPHYFFPWV